MEHAQVIPLEDMLSESDLFCAVYPDLIGEIDRIERKRGKLNEFQLMLAVSYAKDGLGVLSFERRRKINAIFEAFTARYRSEGRDAADLWARETFGCSEASGADAGMEDIPDAASRVGELSALILRKESELLKLYREYYRLTVYTAGEGASPTEG